jgi:ABC-type transporter Mla subunit MlaD
MPPTPHLHHRSFSASLLPDPAGPAGQHIPQHAGSTDVDASDARQETMPAPPKRADADAGDSSSAASDVLSDLSRRASALIAELARLSDQLTNLQHMINSRNLRTRPPTTHTDAPPADTLQP